MNTICVFEGIEKTSQNNLAIKFTHERTQFRVGRIPSKRSWAWTKFPSHWSPSWQTKVSAFAAILPTTPFFYPHRFFDILIPGTFDVSGTSFQAAAWYIPVSSLPSHVPTCATNRWTSNGGVLARAATTPTPIKRIDRLSDILEVKRVIAGGVAVTYWVECCLSGRLEQARG